MATCRSLGSVVCTGLLMVFLPALALGQPATLLRDINTNGDSFENPAPGWDMNGLHVAGDKLYFEATDPSGAF